MVLTDDDFREVADWRRALHRAPELSGAEAETAREVRRFLGPTRPDRIVTGLGGHGVALVYDGAAPGPTVLIRAELDALPIEEVSTFAHRSTRRRPRAPLRPRRPHGDPRRGRARPRRRTPEARPRRAAVPAGGGGREWGRGGDRRSEVRDDRSRLLLCPAQHAGPAAGRGRAQGRAGRLRLARPQDRPSRPDGARQRAGSGGVADGRARPADARPDGARPSRAARRDVRHGHGHPRGDGREKLRRRARQGGAVGDAPNPDRRPHGRALRRSGGAGAPNRERRGPDAVGSHFRRVRPLRQRPGCGRLGFRRARGRGRPARRGRAADARLRGFRRLRPRGALRPFSARVRGKLAGTAQSRLRFSRRPDRGRRARFSQDLARHPRLKRSAR